MSAMVLTYHVHDVGLLTDWQRRSACTEPSQRGYAELGLTPDEMNKMLFGLTMTMVDGGGQRAASEPRRALSLVP
ncbi:hypothetical protein [Streptomyces nojiriensis]|uniref:hypothetical protein n=1 Tax=Streptomyces nojiriensis TaxID=66374 RepID=UPI0035DCCBDA